MGTIKSVRRQRNGNVLVETDNRTYSAKLLALMDIAGCPVQASAHNRTLNSSKGVIKCADLKLCTKEEIIEELRPQGVVDSFNITVKSGENRRPTNTFILTFNTPTAPPHINIGYLRVKVNTYVPNPLRCFNCQKFGHGNKFCRSETVCCRCSGKHTEEGWENAVKCTNCSRPHMASSKECPVWLQGKEVQKVKAEGNLSFPQARQIVVQRNTAYQRPYLCASGICGCL